VKDTKPVKLLPLPPVLPKQKPAPRIDIESSVYEKDLKKMVNNAFEADVHFIVGKDRVFAHRMILSCASTIFYNLFQNNFLPEKPLQHAKPKEKKEENIEDYPEEYICPITQDIMIDPVIAEDGHTYERKNITDWVTTHGTSPITRQVMSKDIIIPNRNLKSQIEQFIENRKSVPAVVKKKKKSKKISNTNSNLPPGFVDFHKEEDKFIITMIPQITMDLLLDLLEFLYTGLLTNTNRVIDLKNLADIFKLPYLTSYCDNIINNTTEYNPSIGTYLNDEAGSRALEYFFNKPLYSDLKITGGNLPLYSAHKCIISARVDVLSRMLNSMFIEATQPVITIQEATAEAFEAFLKYIYTDHCPIEDSPDSIGILELANRFGLTRLITLCELKITKQVEVATADDISKADIDIIGILLASQLHGAKQLEQFCLHFISSNYQPMKKRSEWSKLEGDNLKYIEENQWPPKSYLDELITYEKATKGDETKCILM